MVIKNKLFFPSKTSGSLSHDSSNSPISVGSKSPIQSDTKKPESAPKDETLVPNPLPAGGFVGMFSSDTNNILIWLVIDTMLLSQTLNPLYLIRLRHKNALRAFTQYCDGDSCLSRSCYEHVRL